MNTYTCPDAIHIPNQASSPIAYGPQNRKEQSWPERPFKRNPWRQTTRQSRKKLRKTRLNHRETGRYSRVQTRETMPQGWNEKMEDIRSAMRIIEDMQLQWRQKMVDFRFALQDLEDVQERDGKAMDSALEFFRKIQEYDEGAHKRMKTKPVFGHVQEQSSLGSGRPVWQPIAPWPQPTPYGGPYSHFRVDGLMTSPYGWQPVAPWPQPTPYPGPYTSFRVDGLVTSPYGYLEPRYPLDYIIGKVILSTPNQRMTSDQIYHWIRENFGFYRQKGIGLETSITARLSYTSDFVRMLDIVGMEGGGVYGGGIHSPKPEVGIYWMVRPDRVAKFTMTVWPLDLRQAQIMRYA